VRWAPVGANPDTEADRGGWPVLAAAGLGVMLCFFGAWRLGGLAAFIVASAACAMASSANALLSARVMQAIGAAQKQPSTRTDQVSGLSPF